ncbi:hypothetical protein NDU88_004256 [Pleurodeles waltl]|uniref:Uncharacterized protein n=1 Tax=Pleurodeles waltl TaxID=8319 RepID=A0AAV7W636_PLEWA|nr:hypothetical protein NDU88_004256 [Pleurodeles waltl]
MQQSATAEHSTHQECARNALRLVARSSSHGPLGKRPNRVRLGDAQKEIQYKSARDGGLLDPTTKTYGELSFYPMADGALEEEESPDLTRYQYRYDSKEMTL